MILRLIPALAALLLLAACAGAPAPATAPGTATDPGTVTGTGTAAPALLARVNAARAARGLPALPEASALTRAAAGHAADMGARGYFAHNAPDGSTPLRRMRAAGYDACYAAETIARGQRSEAQVVESWERSRDHAALIFSPNPTAAGAGRAGTHWVMTLARPC